MVNFIRSIFFSDKIYTMKSDDDGARLRITPNPEAFLGVTYHARWGREDELSLEHCTYETTFFFENKTGDTTLRYWTTIIHICFRTFFADLCYETLMNTVGWTSVLIGLANISERGSAKKIAKIQYKSGGIQCGVMLNLVFRPFKKFKDLHFLKNDRWVRT